MCIMNRGYFTKVHVPKCMSNTNIQHYTKKHKMSILATFVFINFIDLMVSRWGQSDIRQFKLSIILKTA